MASTPWKPISPSSGSISAGSFFSEGVTATEAAWIGTVFTVTLTLRFSGSPVMAAVTTALTPAFSAVTVPSSATLTPALLLVKVKSALFSALVLSVPKIFIFAESPSCRPIFVLCS